MPILDLQQRLQEVGRIRMGAQVATQRGGKRPARLPHWRLTSRDELRLQAVAQVYGGEVQPWAEREGEHEVYTESDQLRVLIIPGQALSQWWEMWTGGGCARRCDGHHEYLSDGPCLCPAEYNDRSEQAADGKACKPTTRLAVLLPEVPGIGHWRLETHSYYAAVELAAANHLFEEATRRGALLPARLRIDVRKKIAGGKTTTYPVPVIDIDISAGQLLQLGAGAAEGEVLALPAPEVPAHELGHTPVEDQGGVSVQEGVARMASEPPGKKPRANAAEPIGAAGPAVSTAPLPVEEDGEAAPAAAVPSPQGAAVPAASPEPPANDEPPAAEVQEPPAQAAGAGATEDLQGKMAGQRQRRMLWAVVRERGMGDEQLRSILREVTEQESTASIPAALFDAVLAACQGAEIKEGGK